MTKNKSDIRIEKINKIFLVLDKICRNTGEDEDDNIIDLENYADMRITDEEIEEIRGREIWIWIIEPMNEDLLKYIKKKLENYNFSISKYMKKFEQDGIKYIKYPKKIDICAVRKDIFEIMKEEHGIKSSDLKCYEWAYLQETEIWRRTEVQVAREIIADQMIKHYFIFS